VSMMRDDVLLRELRRLVESIVRFGRAKKEQKSLALTQADGDLSRTVGLPVSLLDAMSDETLLSTISPAGRVDVHKALAIALFLEARGDGEGERCARDRARAASLRSAAMASADRALLLEIERELVRDDA